MLLYRLSLTKYAEDLSGTGAALYGGRWNPVGIPAVYTSGSISLACLEYMAHNFHVMASAQLTLSVIEISEKAKISEILQHELPKDWNNQSYTPQSTQELGSKFFLEKKYYLLKVPSAVVPVEYNFLLNPYHPSHTHTKVIESISPFHLDDRIFGGIV